MRPGGRRRAVPSSAARAAVNPASDDPSPTTCPLTPTRAPLHARPGRRAGGTHELHRLQGRRPVPGPSGPQADPARRARDARPDGHPRRVHRRPAARRCPHHRLAAHDRADRRAHRDAHRARRRGALGELQHLLHPGRGRRRDRRRPRGHDRRPPAACRCSPGRARRSRSTGGAPSRCSRWPDGEAHRAQHDPRRRWRRHAARAQGHRVRGRGRGARGQPTPTPRSGAWCSRPCVAP